MQVYGDGIPDRSKCLHYRRCLHFRGVCKAESHCSISLIQRDFPQNICHAYGRCAITYYIATKPHLILLQASHVIGTTLHNKKLE